MVNEMKMRIISALLLLTILFTFVGCGESKHNNDTATKAVQKDSEIDTATEADQKDTEIDTEIESSDDLESESITDKDDDESDFDFDALTEWYRSNSMLICDGVYFVGDDIVPANYGIKCSSLSNGIGVIVFDSEDSYYAYFHSSRFTNGEENDAIEANASQNEYIYKDKEIALNLHEGNVLLIKNGIGELVLSNSGEAIDKETVIDDTVNLFDGNYIVGKDIDVGSYMFTSTGEYGTRFIVFKSKEKLADFEAADHFTNGEFGADVEQNAMIDIYVHNGEQCYINLQDGMVLMLNNGSGIAQNVAMAWAK